MSLVRETIEKYLEGWRPATVAPTVTFFRRAVLIDPVGAPATKGGCHPRSGIVSIIAHGFEPRVERIVVCGRSNGAIPDGIAASRRNRWDVGRHRRYLRSGR